MEGGGAGSSARSAEALLGQWRLIVLKPRATTPKDIAEPEKYTIAFDAEGRVAVRSDCNFCGGGYTTNGASLSFTPMACTRAYCGDDSLDHKYERLLSAVDRWAIADSRLTLSSAEGALVFVR